MLFFPLSSDIFKKLYILVLDRLWLALKHIMKAQKNQSFPWWETFLVEKITYLRLNPESILQL